MYNSSKTILPLTCDKVFKRVFKDKKVLKGFLNDLLHLEIQSEEDIKVMDSEINDGAVGEKDNRLDVRVTVGNVETDIEMQCEEQDCFNDRSLYYWAKIYSGSLQSGKDYASTRKCVCLNITDFNLFSCDNGLSTFRVLEESRKELLSDKLEIIFLELPKRQSLNGVLRSWTALMVSRSREEVIEMTKNSDKGIKTAAETLLEVNKEPWVKTLKEQREEAAHERASKEATQRRKLERAREQGRAEGHAEGQADLAKKLRGMTSKERDDYLEELSKGEI